MRPAAKASRCSRSRSRSPASARERPRAPASTLATLRTNSVSSSENSSCRAEYAARTRTARSGAGSRWRWRSRPAPPSRSVGAASTGRPELPDRTIGAWSAKECTSIVGRPGATGPGTAISPNRARTTRPSVPRASTAAWRTPRQDATRSTALENSTSGSAPSSATRPRSATAACWVCRRSRRAIVRATEPSSEEPDRRRPTARRFGMPGRYPAATGVSDRPRSLVRGFGLIGDGKARGMVGGARADPAVIRMRSAARRR